MRWGVYLFAIAGALVAPEIARAGIIPTPNYQQSSSNGVGDRVYPTVETGSFSITADMCNTTVPYNSTSAGTATVPNSTLAAGCEIKITQIGAGAVTVVGDGILAVKGYNSGSGPINHTAGQDAGITLQAFSATMAVLYGNH